MLPTIREYAILCNLTASTEQNLKFDERPSDGKPVAHKCGNRLSRLRRDGKQKEYEKIRSTILKSKWVDVKKKLQEASY